MTLQCNRLFFLAAGFAMLAVLVAAPSVRAADEYRMEAIEDAPPEEVAEEVAAQLNSSGVKVVKGTNRIVCEIWLAKSWPLAAGFKATDAVQFPFAPGQLIGVLRFKAKGADFREQEIAKGVYTLRYAQQPVDGNHVGTSPTRDFLLLVAAGKDQSVKPLDVQALTEASAAAAESKHPAMLALKKPGDAQKAPSLTHDEAAELWIATVAGQGESAGKTTPLALGIVVVGHASE